jgi:hypothetical protein
LAFVGGLSEGKEKKEKKEKEEHGVMALWRIASLGKK